MEDITASERERFASKYTTVNDCFLWNGPLDKDGYGTFHFRRRGRRAHRVAWYMAHGDIPAGMVVNHICRNRHCVNVQHLEVITARENSLKDSAGVGALNARKTHCKNGHAFDRFYGKQRYCSICEAAKTKRLRAKWAAEDTVAC